MPGAPYKYAKTIAFRPVDPVSDAKTLIAFGRGLYAESLGDDAAFYRDYGRSGAAFPKWIASCAADNPAFAAMLTEEGEPIGFVVAGKAARGGTVGHVFHLYVKASHRGQGFGGLLDDYARAILRRAGFKNARLNVAARNKRALRFYIAQGWIEMNAGAQRGRLRYMQVVL